ncbi:hypothetical protein [Actinomadura atramentaria]|uniref:hypothetical protein n=1 Tax=Actinomadura atramentaria TaxID=1990 RepID=UPI00037BAB92|nr:hypothetical protein [Actinomadura atramentaria]
MKAGHIGHTEPLPGYRPPVGRWFEPYLTRDGVWRCNLRARLSWAERNAGLLSAVVGASLDAVRELMAHEDERAARIAAVPASRHRETA